MLSTWWTSASHVSLQDDSTRANDFDVGVDSEPNFSKKTTSFRHQALGKERKNSTSMKKKKSKHKRSKSKQQLQSSNSSSRKVSPGQKSTVKNTEISSLCASEERSTPRKPTCIAKEQCKVINLKLPLPSEVSFPHSQYYISKLQEEQEHLKAMIRVEESSPTTPRSRKKGCVSSNPVKRDKSQQQSQSKGGALKSIELVSFVTSDHPTTCADPYSEHQRVVPKSKSVAAPALTTKCSSLFTSLLHQRPDSATNWREFPSSSLNHFSPSLHRKTTQTSLDFPDLALTSRRLPVFNGASLATNSQHTMQDYIFRPVFRYYHQYSGITQPPPKPCLCTNGCRQCLTSIRLPNPAPVVLDYQASQSRPRRNSLDGGRGQYTSSCIELPPLNSTSSDELVETRGLHAQGHSVVRHFPRPIHRKPMRLALYSASMCSRPPPVPSYPDALTSGPPGFHRRLSQMAILVSETVRWENEKPRTKSKKKSSGSSSNNSGSQGSL